MDDEASPDAYPAPVEAVGAVPEVAAADASPAGLAAQSPVEQRLRRLAGRKGPHRGPIVAQTRAWVSRDSRWHIFAARFLDFAVLTEEHLVLCSTGFFSRRPRRQVLREPFTRLVVTPLGEEPIRTLRIVGDFSKPIRIELRGGDENDEFVHELLERTPADPRHRAEPWAMGQLGIDAPAALEAGADADAGAELEAPVDVDAPDEHTAQP
jgi:hypothetical protein